jgi:DNA repair exonuclease SbcCD ATPase subunit
MIILIPYAIYVTIPFFYVIIEFALEHTFTSLNQKSIMKKYSVLIAVILGLGTACKGPQNNESLLQQRDSLILVIDEREANLSEFINSFNDVERNLNTISEKQNIILLGANKEMKLDQKERINAEIKAINKLMEENAKKLNQLNSKLKKSNRQNVALENTTILLNDQLKQKIEELKVLNDKLNLLNLNVAQLQVCIDSLYIELNEQAQTIAETGTELRTAYYVVGETKELMKARLIDKEGGLLGMGRTAKLSDNLDNSKFTQIDYTQVTSIEINSKHANIITSHPDDSYTMNKTGKVIITSPLQTQKNFGVYQSI